MVWVVYHFIIIFDKLILNIMSKKKLSASEKRFQERMEGAVNPKELTKAQKVRVNKLLISFGKKPIFKIDD